MYASESKAFYLLAQDHAFWKHNQCINLENFQVLLCYQSVCLCKWESLFKLMESMLGVVGYQYVYSHLDKYSSVVIERTVMKNKPVQNKCESFKAL